MGRPLNKKYFGNPTGAGNQIVVQADLGSGVVPGWIVRQKGTRTYDVTDGVDTLRCRLVETITGPGEATISVATFAGPIETTYTLLSHRVKTHQGNDTPWTLSAPVDSTRVQIENN